MTTKTAPRTFRREAAARKTESIRREVAEAKAIVAELAPAIEGFDPAEANAVEYPNRLEETTAPVTIEENSITSEDVLSLLADIGAAPVAKPLKANGKPSREEFRYVKNGVSVDGVNYSSTYKAFVALGLAVGRHIGFRAKLKTAGELAYVENGRSYAFKVLTSAPVLTDKAVVSE